MMQEASASSPHTSNDVYSLLLSVRSLKDFIFGSHEIIAHCVYDIVLREQTSPPNTDWRCFSGLRTTPASRCNWNCRSRIHRDTNPASLFNAANQSTSDAVSPTGSRRARITNSVENPPQYSGGPYLPLIGLCFGRFSHLILAALLFCPLHLLQAVARLSSLSSPPLE